MPEFVTPNTKQPLIQKDYETLQCQETGVEYHRVNGVWRMIPAERLPIYDQFICEYETVRLAEGRQSIDPASYTKLPLTSPNHPAAHMWQQRAQSFRIFMERVLIPTELAKNRPLNLLDMGAGNGWLSNQLTQRGHELTAVDLTVNEFDGLGVHQLYSQPFTSIQAEFDHLPLRDNQFDLVIFNASFHYSSDYSISLCESFRVLKASGNTVVIDTPIYQNGESGRQMVAEREALFLHKHGFQSNSLKSENFLTQKQIRAFDPSIQIIDTVPTFRRSIRRLKTKLRGKREAAQFPILILPKPEGRL